MYSLDVVRRFLLIPTLSGNNILFSLTFNNTVGPYYFYKNGNQVANSSLTIGKWQHLAFTIKGSTLSIYIDGILKYNGQTTPIINEYHTNIFFGKNDFPNAEFDDIKIFNKSLSQSEIVQTSSNFY